jgi:hypothetical protein
MVWATFEHVGNTPNAGYTYVNSVGTATPVALDTSGSWLFCATGGAAPFNVNRNRLDSSGNIVPVPPQTTVGPSNTIRWKAWGAAADLSPNPLKNSAASNSEIISINNSVRGLLATLATGDVRGNYLMTGATWTFGGGPTNTNQVGTSQLANTTMETYQQGSDNQAIHVDPVTHVSVTQRNNCFLCHSAGDTSISHVFDDLKPLF